MADLIECNHTQNLFEEFGEPHRGCVLRVNKQEFGVIYTDSEIYSVIWSGEMDLENIEDAIFKSLPKTLSPEKKELDTARFSIEAQLQISNGRPYTSKKKNETAVSNSRLIEYNFNDKKKELNRYKKALKNLKELVFARYDIAEKGRCKGFKFSFTAGKDGEIAVRQPIYQPATPELLEWIIEHHSEGADYKDRLDMDKSCKSINDYLKAR